MNEKSTILLVDDKESDIFLLRTDYGYPNRLAAHGGCGARL